MKGKKWKLAKDALRVGYILILLIYLGMIIEVIATKKISDLWLSMFQSDLVFITAILSQFGVVNHLDKKLYIGGSNGETNNISAASSGVGTESVGLSDSLPGE